MPKDRYEQRFFSPSLNCFHSVLLLRFYVHQLHPAVLSWMLSHSSSLSPLKPINQLLDTICLLQLVEVVSVLSVQVEQKALTCAALHVWFLFITRDSALYLCIRRKDMLGACRSFGGFSGLVGFFFEVWGCLAAGRLLPLL